MISCMDKRGPTLLNENEEVKEKKRQKQTKHFSSHFSRKESLYYYAMQTKITSFPKHFSRKSSGKNASFSILYKSGKKKRGKVVNQSVLYSCKMYRRTCSKVNKLRHNRFLRHSLLLLLSKLSSLLYYVSLFVKTRVKRTSNVPIRTLAHI